jgi:PAS domain S-box-containing protein
MSAKQKRAKNRVTKTGNTHGKAGAHYKDKLIDELRNRVEFLEKELQSRQEGPVAGAEAFNDRLEELYARAYRHQGPSHELEWAALVFQEGEEMYRLIVETTNEGIWILDRENVTSFVNPAMARMLGYSRHEIIGEKPFGFIDNTYKEKVRDHLRKRREGAEEQYVCKYRRKDGGGLWAIITAHPLYDDKGEYAGAFAMVTDITERTYAEMSLKKREADLSLSQKIAHIGSWQWDRETEKIEWSDEFYRILGYEPGEIEPGYKLFMSLVHPDDRELVVSDALKALAEGRSSRLDYRIVRRDGATRYVHVEIIRMLTDRNGRPAGEFGTIQDITERKQAEGALRDSEERTRAFLENSATIAWMKDEEGRFVYLSRNFEKRFCDRLEDWLGKADFELWPEDVARQLCENDLAVLKSGKSMEVVEEVQDQKGYRSWWLISKFPFRDSSGRIYVGGMGVDITGHRNAEKALRENEENLMRAQEIAHLGSWVWDITTNKLHWSDEQYRIFGISSDCETTYELYLSRIHPDDRTYIINAINESLSRRTPCSVDYRIIRPDGEVRFIHGEGLPTYDGDNPVSMIGTLQDITERKLTEKELANAKVQAELYLDLMGHDINNMHQIALGYLELAREMYPEAGDGQFLDKSMEVLQRSARLIQNVRKLQKLREGVFQAESVDICRLLSDVQREFGAVPYKQVTLNLNGHERCLVRANELLHDVFSNLVSNAIKHTGYKADIVIDLDVEEENGRHNCRVSVEDNGRGIPDDFKGKVFNRLLEGTDKAKGMGLGLYLVKSLVESYGGRVWVEDRVPGDHTRGSKFVVTLPVSGS